LSFGFKDLVKSGTNFPSGPSGKLPASAKLVAALVLVMAVALMPRRPDPLYWLPTALLAATWAGTRMPFAHAWTRLLVVEPFVLAIALLSLVRPESAPIFFAAIIKSNLCLMTMLLLTFTTPFPELLQVLRRCRVPTAMLTTLALMVRYLPVLAEESRRMQRARASRTFTRRRRVAWASLGAVAGQLFARTADRAERIYLAMCARGWK
jgi:cobalt/nickel transport system permease protein